MTSSQLPAGRIAPPLDQPYYGASLGAAVARFFKNYATFTGRASRAEYWWYFLFYTVVTTILELPLLVWLAGFGGRLLDQVIKALEAGESASSADLAAGLDLADFTPGVLALASAAVSVIWYLGTLVPSLAVNWRRLHDAGFSGAFWLFNLINLGIVPLIMCILPPKPEGARFDKAAPGGQPGQAASYWPPAGQGGYGPFDGAYAPPGYGPEPAPPLGPPPEGPVGPDGLPRYPG
ncbi:MAG: DUF805 domain-containing protein [Bifidobacteriaceae bacterium]|nr:DUF805 domain-containing protein [Bifidobacteriaceae bacterium]